MPLTFIIHHHHQHHHLIVIRAILHVYAPIHPYDSRLLPIFHLIQLVAPALTLFSASDQGFLTPCALKSDHGSLVFVAATFYDCLTLFFGCALIC